MIIVDNNADKDSKNELAALVSSGQIFKRTSSGNTSDANNIYLALPDGTAAIAGAPSSTNSYLRVGATNDNALPEKDDTAMVVAGVIESRGGLFIKKINNNTELSNSDSNRKTTLDRNFTSLDLATRSGTVDFKSENKDQYGDPQPISFIFSAIGASTKVGINNTNPTKTLDVIGTAGVTESLTVGFPVNSTPSTDKLAINGSTRANAYYYNSDRRYKSDIEVLKSPLEKLLQISGYSYYSKLEQKDTIGVIAQEVEAVYPNLVQTDAQGYKSVQYGNLVAPIIEALKELSHKIDSLFTLYVSQQAKIDTLEARLLKLEAKIK